MCRSLSVAIRFSLPFLETSRRVRWFITERHSRISPIFGRQYKKRSEHWLFIKNDCCLNLIINYWCARAYITHIHTCTRGTCTKFIMEEWRCAFLCSPWRATRAYGYDSFTASSQRNTWSARVTALPKSSILYDWYFSGSMFFVSNYCLSWVAVYCWWWSIMM